MRYHFKILVLLSFFSVAVCHAQTTTEKKLSTSSVETSVKTGPSVETSVKTGPSVETSVKVGSSTEISTKANTPLHKNPLRIIFDDSNAQLIGIDSSGKVVENVIIAFQLFVKIKGIEHSEQALGSYLNKSMRDLLAQAESNTILFFEHIQVKNAAGNLIEAEDFQYTLSYLPKEKK